MARLVEALENGGASHGVDAGPRLLRVRLAVEQLQSLGCSCITRANASQPNVTGPGCVPRAVIYFHSARNQSTFPTCPKDLIMAPKMGTETFDDMQQSVQQWRQRLHVFQPVACLDRTPKQRTINLRPEHQIEGSFDVAF